MSYVLATPEMVAAAANNLAQIGSTLSAANAAALAPTTGVLAAGADEVSAAVASLFSGHAQAYQTLGTQAAAFHERFIQALSTAAGAYGSAEAANASPLQQALNVINAPTQTLLGRPLIGNGTNGAPAGRAASATAVRVATRHCCSATAGRAGPAAPAASVPAEPAASARFCLATAGLAGAVPPVASAPVAMAETRCWSATAATVGQVPVGLLAVPVARAGCYSAKMGCPGRERPNPGQPPMGNLHINWPGRQQTAHIYEIGSRSVGGAGKSGCKSWLGSVGWRRA